MSFWAENFWAEGFWAENFWVEDASPQAEEQLPTGHSRTVHHRKEITQAERDEYVRLKRIEMGIIREEKKLVTVDDSKERLLLEAEISTLQREADQIASRLSALSIFTDDNVRLSILEVLISEEILKHKQNNEAALLLLLTNETYP